MCLPLLAVAGDPPNEAAALIAKHQAYVGWHAGDGVVKTLRKVGELRRDGKMQRTLRYELLGVAHRWTSVDKNELQSSSGFTGSVYWTSNENGFTVRPVGEVARYLYDDDVIDGELTEMLSPAMHGRATVDGTELPVVRLTGSIGFPIDVAIDPATGAFKRVVIDPDGKYETTINGIEYKETAGKRFVSSFRYGDSKSTYAFATIEPNAAITPDDLHPPKQTATWTFGQGSAPVELTQDTFPRVLVDASVNGVKARFILDTGAASTVLTDSFLRKAGAKKLGESRIAGIGGTVGANLFRVDGIEIAGSTLHNVIARSGLDEQWMAAEGVAGLIGFDLLAAAIVDLNFDAKTLTIQDPAKVEPNQSDGLVVHADLSTHHIRVPMKVNRKIDVIATLDSGNPLNVLFSRDLIRRDHLTFFVNPGELGSTRYGGGIGGLEVERCGSLDSLTMGPVEYKPVPACDSPSFGRNEVLVGLDFMKNFNYVFSYPDGIVVMRKRQNP